MSHARKRVVLVTGLSGAGKSSILRTLEDLGYETVDNPPLPLIEELVAGGDNALAVGVDARRRGFCAEAVLDTLARLQRDPVLRPELVFAWAEEAALLRRYTETRRRHPLAPQGRVADGIAAEERLTAPLRQAADLLLDTTDLPPAALRRRVEQLFSPDDRQDGLVVSLVSFAYPAGLPREADLVLDARFLRNPHYDTFLRQKTGLDPAVGAFVESDPDFTKYYNQIKELLALLLPRFVQEGKRYATVAVGCTGGRHRSVHIIERIAIDLAGAGWRVMRAHRELAREGAAPDIGVVAPSAPARPSQGAIQA
jgi:UPF0042 nucleotide-binding protein